MFVRIAIDLISQHITEYLSQPCVPQPPPPLQHSVSLMADNRKR